MHIKIPDFTQGNILVIGDVMLDRYWHGNTDRISPEAPVPVVHIRKSEEGAGGAANVALNVGAIGSNVKLLGITGEDKEAELLEQFLTDNGINYYFARNPNLPTINKLRVLSRHQQLIRLDFEEKFHDDNETLDDLFAVYTKELEECDLVIFSDYGKGTLRFMQELIEAARALNKPVLIDPKGKDFTIYRGATIITPNFEEFCAVVGFCRNENELQAKAQWLIENYDFEAILVTRGEHGMSLITKNSSALHIPAKAREVFDVTGAGDTSIAILGASLAAGADLETAVVLANTAGGIVVGKLGAATISLAELRRALQRNQQTPEAGILTEEELLHEVDLTRARGEKIVMTNGCFDILHAGHITYLEEAKSLGQRLIVAVNDDASVARLKGPKRPINSLKQRMLVLAALRAVDFVVPFSEDTPARIIEKIAPDILVKGGDWKPEEIVGADFVLQNGGEVKSITFVKGVSTTRLIKKIEDE